jgi:hypothetical protein
LLLREGTIFTDGNAACDNTLFARNIDMLEMISWDIITANRWDGFIDGKRKRQAEALVPMQVDLSSLAGIFAYSELSAAIIRTLNDKTDIVTDSDRYFFF